MVLSSTWPPYISSAELSRLLNDPIGNPAVRPNTPVMPYGTVAKAATFIDTTARITNGYAVIVGYQGFIGPYAKLDAHGGIIKIGNGSAVLDNAAIVANSVRNHQPPAPEVLIGEKVQVGYGATILGPSVIGAYGSTSQPTEIGPGAVIERATVMPGASVSALARVGPGVTVPTGMRVLPGKFVTTDAEASDPALGKVVPLTTTDQTGIRSRLTANQNLAVGYTTLYQGISATGVSPGVEPTVTNVFNGNLSNVEGAGPEPGSGTTFLPPGPSPSFPSPRRGLIQATLIGFPARVTGQVRFGVRANVLTHRLGRSNAIRADLGQPITIASIARTGASTTINSPAGGALTIGRNLRTGAGVVLLGAASRSTAVIGDNVTIGGGAVVDQTSLGSGSTVGARAYVSGSSFPAGTNIPAGAVYINNRLIGRVEW